MNKSESKYFNTARIMDNALIELLCQKELPYITVKEVCEKAGVNRSTFYLHYETIGDLLEETVEFIQKEFDESFQKELRDSIELVETSSLDNLLFIDDRFLIPYLEFIRTHKHIFKATIQNPVCMKTDAKMQSWYEQVFTPIFTRFGIPEKEHKYWLVYHIIGITAIINEWIKEDCRESVSEISRIIQNCVRPGRYRSEKK